MTTRNNRALANRTGELTMFRAFFITSLDGTPSHEIREIDTADLPAGDVVVDVSHSSVNYKDGLAISGKGKIIRGTLPFVPGIDLAGTVISSDSEDFRPDDRVLATGWGLGEKNWGGYTERARLHSEWLVPIPSDLSNREAMILGTAGLTAMLAVMALEGHGVRPDEGEVVVTGASGGVGSIAVALLSRLGFTVVASTGKESAHPFLRALGASRFIGRDDVSQSAGKPLASARWSGAVDTVGGETLAGILAELRTHGSVASCGNARSAELHTTVFPFILRGTNLLGIDSNTASGEQRRKAWQRLATDLPKPILSSVESRAIPLADLPAAAEEITRGAVRGRIVVDVKS
ncbi:MAG: MDR family oxidoreductase [Thermoanaerobaculia bacterium]